MNKETPSLVDRPLLVASFSQDAAVLSAYLDAWGHALLSCRARMAMLFAPFVHSRVVEDEEELRKYIGEVGRLASDLDNALDDVDGVRDDFEKLATDVSRWARCEQQRLGRAKERDRNEGNEGKEP